MIFDLDTAVVVALFVRQIDEERKLRIHRRILKVPKRHPDG